MTAARLPSPSAAPPVAPTRILRVAVSPPSILRI
jgi:hypothetical protein